MILVDSSGWLEFLADTPNAGHYADAIGNPEDLLVPVICLMEVYKKVLRERGEEAAMVVAAHMRLGRVVDIDADVALTAADLGLKHGLAMADSLILACARLHDAEILTQDAHFEGIPGVRVFQKKS